jgi:hypothetical protein
MEFCCMYEQKRPCCRLAPSSAMSRCGVRRILPQIYLSSIIRRPADLVRAPAVWTNQTRRRLRREPNGTRLVVFQPSRLQSLLSTPATAVRLGIHHVTHKRPPPTHYPLLNRYTIPLPWTPSSFSISHLEESAFPTDALLDCRCMHILSLVPANNERVSRLGL